VAEQSALVVALLGDSVVDLRLCDRYRIGVELPIADAEPCTLVEPVPGGVTIHAARYRHGNVTVFATPVERPRKLAHGFDVDRRWAGYLALSLAVHALVWGVAISAPVDALGIGVAIGDTPGVSLTATTSRDDAPVRLVRAGRDESPDETTGGSGAPMVLDAGAAGDPDSAHARGHIAVMYRGQDPQLTREDAIAQVRSNSMLGAIENAGEGLRALAATGDLASGWDMSNVYGTLFGGTGEANGSFGLARDGFGASAGCAGEDCGTIGVGRYGTLSNGSVDGRGWGNSHGGAETIRREARVPVVVMCGGPGPCAAAIGDLDKAVIRRYLRRHLDQIQYCYEKELLARPGIVGEITTEFLISADGTVTSSRAEGFDPAVATCVADVIARIAFPRSSHGGNTQVHYPFAFHLPG
jgi:hypothetical protein